MSAPPPDAAPEVTLFVRVMLAPGLPLGPGKAELLQAIAETGSIAAAARRMGMSYQRAHDLVADLNGCFAEPLVAAAKGGAGRGGAALTSLGEQVLAAYRSVQKTAVEAAAPQLAWLASQRRRQA
jgi:molybdate transport system regulatory protein